MGLTWVYTAVSLLRTGSIIYLLINKNLYDVTLSNIEQHEKSRPEAVLCCVLLSVEKEFLLVSTLKREIHLWQSEKIKSNTNQCKTPTSAADVFWCHQLVHHGLIFSTWHPAVFLQDVKREASWFDLQHFLLQSGSHGRGKRPSRSWDWSSRLWKGGSLRGRQQISEAEQNLKSSFSALTGPRSLTGESSAVAQMEILILSRWSLRLWAAAKICSPFYSISNVCSLVIISERRL